MSAVGDVVARYHGLMEQNGFKGMAWAEELQQRMHKRRLTDSGRLLSPVLRPCFVTQQQLDTLAKIAAQLSSIFDQLESFILAKPAWLSKLQMLPAEKSLLAIPPGYKHFSMAGTFDASFQGANCLVTAIDACRPAGLAYAGALADIFLQLPVILECRRSGFKISKVPALRRIDQCMTAAWQQFGGKGKPAIAVVDWAHATPEGASEGELLAGTLAMQGLDVRFVPPEKLVFQNGELSSGERRIDLVLRRILARELLTRWDLNHPLLEAYRARAVCMVNSFRAEIGQRRAFLELLTDDSVTAHLPAADRKLLQHTVRWTRVLSARKVQHGGADIDLLDWVVKHREQLTLLPDQPTPELRTYAGSQMTNAAWEWAIRQSLRTPYVVQECVSVLPEAFPFYQYGELKARDVEVTLQPQILSGELGDCLAVLHATTSGNVTPQGIAPVLLVS